MHAARTRRDRLTGGVVVAAAMAIMNVTTYGLTLAAARLLGPDEFGQFSAVLGALIVVNVGSLALQATGARRVSTSLHARHQIESDVMATTRRVAVALLVIGLATAPLLDRVLRLESIWSALSMAVAAALLCLMGGQAGILQGEQRWTPLSLMYAAMGTARLGCGLGALLVHRSAAAALIGVAVGAAVPAAVGAWALRHPDRTGDRSATARPARSAGAPWEHGSILREVAHSSHALFAFFAASNVDVLLARAVLAPHDAGLYSAGLVLTKAVLFLPQFVVVVLFPSMAQSRTGARLHVYGLGTILAVGTTTSLAVLVLPGLTLQFAGGPTYADVGPLLWAFAVLGTVLAMTQFLVYSALARSHPRAVVTLWVGLVATIAGGLFVDSVSALLWLKLGIDVVVLLALAIQLLLVRSSGTALLPEDQAALLTDVTPPEQSPVR